MHNLIQGSSNGFQNLNTGVSKHQSVGKNGTFWLPPKTTSTSFDEVMGSSKKPSNGKSSAKSFENSKQSESKSNKQNPTIAISKKIESPLVKNINVAKVSYQQLPKNLSNLSHRSASSHRVHSLLPKDINRNSQILHTDKINHAANFDHKNTNKLNHTEPSKYVWSGKDSGAKEEKNRRKGGGTDIATNLKDADNPIQSEGNMDGFDPNDPRDCDLQAKLGHSIVQGFSTRISRFAKDGFTVLRFSQDLPNGGQYSVKIEKANNEMLIHFISDQPIIRTLLENSMDSMIQVFKSSFSTQTNISSRILSSYRELTQTNSLIL
jgi:hypothetical protein